jgi:hypothetical protein
MQGTDELRIMGKNAPTATYTPGTNTANGIDGNPNYDGTITLGATVINFQEFEADAAGALSNLTVQDVTTFIAGLSALSNSGLGIGKPTGRSRATLLTW